MREGGSWGPLPAFCPRVLGVTPFPPAAAGPSRVCGLCSPLLLSSGRPLTRPLCFPRCVAALRCPLLLVCVRSSYCPFQGVWGKQRCCTYHFNQTRIAAVIMCFGIHRAEPSCSVMPDPCDPVGCSPPHFVSVSPAVQAGSVPPSHQRSQRTFLTMVF